MILEELSKHDSKWRKIAYYICKDKMLADDLTNEMYLKIKDKPEFNDYFVTIVLKNIFLNKIKERRNVRIDDLIYLEDNVTEFEPNDKQKEILDEFDKLHWVKKEYILEQSTGESVRKIGKRFNTNYGYVYSQATKGKNQIKENLKFNKMKEPKDKRTKAYKEWKKWSKKQPKGLGDTIEKALKKTGVKKLVSIFTDGKDCGCDKRKDKLNEIFPYRRKPQRCLTELQYNEYKKYVENRTLNVWQENEIKLLIDTYAWVFAIQYSRTALCRNCAGSGKILLKLSKDLDKVFESYNK